MCKDFLHCHKITQDWLRFADFLFREFCRFLFLFFLMWCNYLVQEEEGEAKDKRRETSAGST